MRLIYKLTVSAPVRSSVTDGVQVPPVLCITRSGTSFRVRHTVLLRLLQGEIGDSFSLFLDMVASLDVKITASTPAVYSLFKDLLYSQMLISSEFTPL